MSNRRGTISERHLKHIFILYASHAVVINVVLSLVAKLDSHPKVLPPRNIDFFKSDRETVSQGDKRIVNAENLNNKYKQRDEANEYFLHFLIFMRFQFIHEPGSYLWVPY
jgi:hypothetical protein